MERRRDRSERAATSDPRVFTVEEANRALPRLRALVAQQLARMAELEAGMRRGREARARGEDVTAVERAIHDRIDALEAGWREVEEMGVVVKDPHTGLCDFHGRVEGRLVWLCWKYGEEAVTHYHELDAGFAGRKRLEGAPQRLPLN